jgi:NAD(P)-dependent dehydrogenase (short-subunit alcohol dehydrogenase family)
MAVTHAVLPVMRRQRAGRIFNISSVAGFRSVFGASIYSSTKFAVEGLSRGLAEEVAEFGVYVTLIEPGFFRTEFLESDSLKYSEGPAIPEYSQRLEQFRTFHHKRNGTQLGDPAKLARILLQLAEAEKPPVSFLAGSDAVQWVREILKAQEAQINANHDLSVSTDIPGVTW